MSNDESGSPINFKTPMSAEQFEHAYAARSGLTVEELRDLGRTVLPCECGEDGCDGWQSVSALPDESERTNG